jgi:hypothetical protein
MSDENAMEQHRKRGLSGWHVFLIVLVTALITVAITFWVVRTWIFPSEFKPVELTVQEEQVLETKLERLDTLQAGRTRGSAKAVKRNREAAADSKATGEAQMLEPEAYSEEGADRSISLSERELNALLARNTDLARRLAIDLSEDLLSAKLLVHVDPDFPVLGGQIIKVRAGMELAYRNDRPVAILKGVSVMGVPVPSAWLGGMKNIDLVESYGSELGGMKNIDLVESYGSESGFWKAFADGVDNIRIRDGSLTMVLKQ